MSKKRFLQSYQQLLTILRREIARGQERINIYIYVVQRIGPKVQYVYKGKMSPEDIKLYKNAKIPRAKYRNLLSQVKKQIRFLKGSLRGKEAV